MELSILATLAVIFALAFLVETLVEALFGTAAAWLVGICPNLEGRLGYFKTPAIQTLSFIAGIGGAFLFHFDVIYLLGGFVQAPDIPLTAYGMVTTGLAIGKGSNYIHQFIAQFFPAR